MSCDLNWSWVRGYPGSIFLFIGACLVLWWDWRCRHLGSVRWYVVDVDYKSRYSRLLIEDVDCLDIIQYVLTCWSRGHAIYFMIGYWLFQLTEMTYYDGDLHLGVW